MKLSDIEAVARGLRDARPNSYPMGLPDTDAGWPAWQGVVHSMTKAVAGTCSAAGWSAHRALFEDIVNNEKG